MWKPEEIAAIQRDLLSTSTAAIAACYGVHEKALRSTLRRHGVSIRYVRRMLKPRRPCGGGITVRRPTLGAAASYGAAALAELPDHACRWPIGDPADKHFCFCGLRKGIGESYCKAHRARAYESLTVLVFKSNSNGEKTALQSGAYIDRRAPRTSS